MMTKAFAGATGRVESTFILIRSPEVWFGMLEMPMSVM